MCGFLLYVLVYRAYSVSVPGRTCLGQPPMTDAESTSGFRRQPSTKASINLQRPLNLCYSRPWLIILCDAEYLWFLPCAPSSWPSVSLSVLRKHCQSLVLLKGLETWDMLPDPRMTLSGALPTLYIWFLPKPVVPVCLAKLARDVPTSFLVYMFNRPGVAGAVLHTAS